MRINFKKNALQGIEDQVQLTLNARLPSHIPGPCVLDCIFSFSSGQDYWLLNFRLQGEIALVCQRCLKTFDFPFNHQGSIAICPSDEIADRLLSHYETIVEPSNQIDLSDIITDELHLHAPQMHESIRDCDAEILRFVK